MARATGEPAHESVQTLVDALSVALRRPVLLDDPALVPLAYSRQWGEIDVVRSDSILSRGASEEVRRELERRGITSAEDVVEIASEPALGMARRLCLPLRRDGRLLGYIWLLDPSASLSASDLERVRATAERVVDLLARSERRTVADESPLLAGLGSEHPAERAAAEAEARARRLLPRGPVVVCLVEPLTPALDTTALAGRAARRLSQGHALVGTVRGRAALLAALSDPVLATLRPTEVARWLHTVVRADVAVGQSGVAARLDAFPAARREAEIALRAAAARPAAEAHAAWAELGSERLIAQLPAAAAADLPPGLARLLREEPELAVTLATFLDAAGDVRATAAALALHRSGLYYRLGRIEQMSGLDLSAGDDRLLAHLAIRLAGVRR